MPASTQCTACATTNEIDLPFCISCGATIGRTLAESTASPLKEPLKATTHKFKGLPSDLLAFFRSVQRSEKAYEKRMYRWVFAGFLSLIFVGIAVWRLVAGGELWLWPVIGFFASVFVLAVARALAADEFDIPDERLEALIGVVDFFDVSGRIGDEIEVVVDFSDLEWEGGELVEGERLDGLIIGHHPDGRTTSLRQPWLRLSGILKSGAPIIFGAVAWLEKAETYDRELRKRHLRTRSHEVIEIRIETDQHTADRDGLKQSIAQLLGQDFASVRAVESAPGNFTVIVHTPVKEAQRTVKEYTDSADRVEDVVVSKGRAADGQTIAAMIDAVEHSMQSLGARFR